MSRKKRQGRGRSIDRFWMLTFSMARSPAFRSLSGAALKVFIELRCRYDGSNGARLHLSYRQAEKLLGLGRATIQRAYAELVQKGFVRQTRQGARFCRLASEWNTTDLPLNADTLPTNDWRRWQRPLNPKRGFRGRPRNRDLVAGAETSKALCPATETKSALGKRSNGSALETHVHTTMQGVQRKDAQDELNKSEAVPQQNEAQEQPRGAGD